MKKKISITLDEETMKLIEKTLKEKGKENDFRNRSHIIEFSINKTLKEDD